MARLNSTRLFLLFAFCLLSFELASQTNQTPNSAEPMQAQAESPLVAEIDQMLQNNADLASSMNSATGEDRDALQTQLFVKNQELRKLLARAINNEAMDSQRLLQLVRQQEVYSKQAYSFINKRLTQLNDQINKASDDSKLSLINQYGELQSYLNSVLQSSWENIEWMRKLGQGETDAQARLTEQISQRLRLLSASIDYIQQQLSVIGRQLSVSLESDKSGLQLSQLVTQQKLDIVVQSMINTYTLADKLGLPTAEYKRQVFSATGNITRDILDWDVLLSIIKHWSYSVWDWTLDNAPQVIFQLVILALILFAAKFAANLTQSVVRKTVAARNFKLSQLMQDFFISMAGKVVWVIGILVGLSQIGLDLAPVLTGFGIAGVIIGFALQDTLSNFAAGMMLLIYRPFDVGDFVYAGGVDGKVSHMSLVNTTIRTFDNQIIIVPNSKIWGDVIKNVTHERIRRVDMVFGIGYQDDLTKAEAVLGDIISNHPAVLRSPEPMIKVHVLNTSSVDFIVRPWVKTDDYWDVYWDVTREVKLRFDREGITIPFPQQDVHLYRPQSSQA
ncbi:mechanosensitive ion channel [Shewanella submarina]|uniref:Small-conductance mechanosensitive channel n=1 Tax=Shewanella submarina TaxID=2016376 RepID=A0ABV7GHN2_9GAMM|nr:mechanosensitive ion channel family protein [Shewanella submarina]MCL1038206.1 mechanosensitive ion channel [Shewanella submarina]